MVSTLPSPHESNGAAGRPATVLVVEQDAAVAEDIRSILLQLGYRVAAAVTTGPDAIAAVERSAPTLALVDLDLQGVVDGIETAAQLRDRFDLPVVSTAPYARGALDDAGHPPLPFDCLLKPFNARELCTAIEGALAAHGLRDPADFMPPSARRPPAPRRGRILAVDPEPALTAAVRRVLGRDHDVVARHEVPEALACIATSEPFDLVLCDLGSPRLMGLDVYEKLVDRNDETASRVVFLGSGECPPHAKRVLESIANPLLPKPFSAERLRALASDYVR